MNPIETSRLRIRPFVETDLEAVARVLDECFGAAPREERREWLEWSVRNYPALAKLGQPPYGDYAVVDKGTEELVGAVGLVPSFGPFGQLPMFRRAGEGAGGLYRPEMGLFWAVAAAHRGRGYAAEAAAAMAGFAFEALRVERVVATTERDNAASIGVMRKIGMVVESNPEPTPEWFQVVGVIFNPAAGV
jgi:RimJ/RimL family protein N-acetyltransferase